MSATKWEDRDGQWCAESTALSNLERTHRAYSALRAWRIFTGAEEDESNITDLLTDLMHHCRREGEEFDDHLRRARMHHEAEASFSDD